MVPRALQAGALGRDRIDRDHFAEAMRDQRDNFVAVDGWLVVIGHDRSPVPRLSESDRGADAKPKTGTNLQPLDPR
jgi:hypothetical protein